MEGVYSHPVYGGNRDYRGWKAFGYAGDVHGVRFPQIGPPDAPWNVYGGYAPEEMACRGRRAHEALGADRRGARGARAVGRYASLRLARPPRAQPAARSSTTRSGPIRDVTANWLAYQPAQAFCVKPNVGQYTPGGDGPTGTGRDPACRRSGFARGATGLVGDQRPHADPVPRVPAAVHRLLEDPERRQPADLLRPRARLLPAGVGELHATRSTRSRTAPTPRTSPTTSCSRRRARRRSSSIGGARPAPVASGYTTDTLNFVHTAVQGPYYIGPWYVNRGGRRIYGVYLDVDVADATAVPGRRQPNDDRLRRRLQLAARRCPNDARLVLRGLRRLVGAQRLDRQPVRHAAVRGSSAASRSTS